MHKPVSLAGVFKVDGQACNSRLGKSTAITSDCSGLAGGGADCRPGPEAMEGQRQMVVGKTNESGTARRELRYRDLRNGALGSVEIESRENTMSEEGPVVSTARRTAMGDPVFEEWGVVWARELGTHEHNLEKEARVDPSRTTMPEINKKL
ncbi:uncharacterized protein P884DRAFT_328690 [Thermothelomyces heterothallicus CBS 202.75]|uniref:uncharacterized protein n=1 Tax=Thermothelomyces heterothallicus CBS 202.75 TaxID=1149848 RepID=UPI0037446A65